MRFQPKKNLDRLLERILREAQQFACCDAASLYLVEKHEHESDKLAFKLTNNDSIAIDFREQRFDLDNRSIVGYVATMDQELNIRDAHNISDQTQYSFNPEMDARMGYRTVSILTLPNIVQYTLMSSKLENCGTPLCYMISARLVCVNMS